ncbi:hypothetical protein AAID96_03415 [Campylobacter coli]
MENILILETKNQMLEYKNQIEKLFEKIFLKKLINFEHMFTESPYGCKIVCYIENKNILGVGVISFFEFRLNNVMYRYYLFTTSMIDESVRSKGVYFEILDAIKNIAFMDNADFILAFPNHRAYPILSYTFQLLSRYSFVLLDDFKLLSYKYPKLDFSRDYLDWRFQKNKYYQFNTKLNGRLIQIIYKIYNQKIDILHIFEKKVFINLEERAIRSNEKILAPMPIDNISKKESPEGVLNMMYFPVRKTNLRLDFSPILSDVF